MKIVSLLILLISMSFSNPAPDYSLNVTKVDRAVIKVLDSINPISITCDIEHGGNVYYSPVRGIIVTPPQTNNKPHNVLIIPDTILLNNGFIKIGHYHTHAASNPDYLDETFSRQDTTKTHYKEYLATPMGKILKYDPRFGRMLILNRKENRWDLYYFSALVGEDEEIDTTDEDD